MLKLHFAVKRICVCGRDTEKKRTGEREGVREGGGKRERNGQR